MSRKIHMAYLVNPAATELRVSWGRVLGALKFETVPTLLYQVTSALYKLLDRPCWPFWGTHLNKRAAHTYHSACLPVLNILSFPNSP